MIGKKLDTYISEKVAEVLSTFNLPDYDGIHTDTLGELIDRLIIQNIRYWHLEDAMSMSKTDSELREHREKAMIVFQQKRPMLIKALDKLFIELTRGKVGYTPSDLKNYASKDKDSSGC